MRPTSLLSCILFLCVGNAGAQAKIVVNVSNFRNDKGMCLVALYDNALAFAGKGTPVRTLKVSIANKASQVTIDDVQAGTYAVSVIHDANGNRRFDTNFIGIPTEGYGASQNKLPFASAPKFDANKFSVTDNSTTVINIRLRYLL